MPLGVTQLRMLTSGHSAEIRNNAAASSQGDAALRMVALGRLENGAGELGARGTSKDALDGIASTIVPQLHAKRELLRRGRPITLQDFVPALAFIRSSARGASLNAAAGSNGI